MNDPDQAESVPSADLATLAESIRRALVQAGALAYEDAGIQGLCAEGRWEAAVSAMRAVDVAELVRGASASHGTRRSATGWTRP